MYVLFGQKLGLFQFLIPNLFSVTVFTFSLFRKVFALKKWVYVSVTAKIWYSHNHLWKGWFLYETKKKWIKK